VNYEFEPVELAAATGNLEEEPHARAHADVVEFRMDLATDPLPELAAYDGELPLIATNRAKWEGGDAPDDGRLEALADAATHESVVAVDIELASLEDGAGSAVLDAADDHDTTVIVSTHDFEMTPSADEIDRLLTDACEYGDIGKLAVTAESRSDTLTLLHKTRAHADRGEKIATMAMGEIGGHTRAIAGIYGSCIGYAPVEASRATAPGQYDLETLARLVDDLSPA
jgi:3-dehydroquinate dehydratase-1